MTIPCSVYMIFNDIDDSLYVGCTTKKLWQRMAKHEQHMHNMKCPLLHEKMLRYGSGHFNIRLLEFAEVATKKDKLMLEQKWIDTLKPNLNMNKAFQSRDDRLRYMRDYNNRKVHCLCGSVVRAGGLSCHYRTDKHMKYSEKFPVIDNKDSSDTSDISEC